ncbi:response regulator transcription factor [Scrofimicrobium canadense]|nr:hypothetical protein [Scrofimicrobium canadense]
MTIRVLIVDDHPVVRSGIAGMIETDPEISVCSEAGDGKQALASLAS